MGANYSHYKIEFKSQEHSDFLNNLFLDFQDYKFPKILNEKNPFEELFNETNFTKIKHALAFAWCAKGDGLAIEKFHLNENFFELEIYGGSDMMIMEELIFHVSYYWGCEYCLELQSTTRADGLNFRWIKNDKAFQYYDNQSENFEELNLDNGFDYCFNYINELQKNEKIEVTEIKIGQPNELEFLNDLQLFPDYLERIKDWNEKWEIEQERNRQRLLNWNKNNSTKKSRKSLGKGIQALLGRIDDKKNKND